jgi:hypothetical protein
MGGIATMTASVTEQIGTPLWSCSCMHDDLDEQRHLLPMEPELPLAGLP